jgi:ABC-2 type transport system permease protein
LNLSKSWTVAAKDFKVFRRKKNILASTVALPLLVSVLLPAVILYATNRGAGKGIPDAELPILLPAFIFFFVIISAPLITAIASYALVGEKVEKSLEPLLATPTTDGEILLGKSIAAFLPPMASIYAGATIFMALMDLVTFPKLGYYYFPNWGVAIILLLLAPLAAILSVEANVIVSARVSDVRAAQQLGVLTTLPFAGIYLAGELGLISLDTNTLLSISGLLVIADLLLFFISTATFRRDEILTKWK